MATVTILGSGTLLPDDERRSAAHLVEDGDLRLLLDCGSGTLHGMARHGIAWRELTHVALSHFHTDHTGDLPALLWALKHGVEGGRERALVVLGPRGLEKRLGAMAEAFGPFILDPGFPVEVVELGVEGRWMDGDHRLEIHTHPARHTPEAVAFRVRTPGGVVGYSGDTGPAPSLGNFFRGVDLLVCECAMSDDAAMEAHLSPRSVARLARDARPELLVLTHAYPPLDPDQIPDLIRRQGYTGPMQTGRDGLKLQLGSA